MPPTTQWMPNSTSGENDRERTKRLWKWSRRAQIPCHFKRIPGLPKPAYPPAHALHSTNNDNDNDNDHSRRWLPHFFLDHKPRLVHHITRYFNHESMFHYNNCRGIYYHHLSRGDDYDNALSDDNNDRFWDNYDDSGFCHYNNDHDNGSIISHLQPG